MTATTKKRQIGAKCRNGLAFICRSRTVETSNKKRCDSAALLARNWAFVVHPIPLRPACNPAFANRLDAKRFLPDTTLTINSLEIIGGALVHGGKCYGNWDVSNLARDFCRPPKSPPLSKQELAGAFHYDDNVLILACRNTLSR